MWQTDGHTDRHTDILPRHSPRYAYASRGKGRKNLIFHIFRRNLPVKILQWNLAHGVDVLEVIAIICNILLHETRIRWTWIMHILFRLPTKSLIVLPCPWEKIKQRNKKTAATEIEKRKLHVVFPATFFGTQTVVESDGPSSPAKNDGRSLITVKNSGVRSLGGHLPPCRT